MSISIGQLIGICQTSYNSAAGDTFFTDAWYISMIWRAETELAIQGWVIEDTFVTTSVSGTRELAYPTNTLAIREVRYAYKKLSKETLAEDPKTDVTDPSGTPYIYAIWDNTIILMPTPNVTGDTIQVRAYVSPSQLLSSTDTLNVPSEYQVQMADYILAQMCFKDQNLALGQVYLQKWEQTVERCRQQRKRRLRGDKQMVVKDTYFGSEGSNRFGGVFNG